MGKQGISNDSNGTWGRVLLVILDALRENEIASIIQELEVVHTVACHMLLGKSWHGRWSDLDESGGYLLVNRYDM